MKCDHDKSTCQHCENPILKTAPPMPQPNTEKKCCEKCIKHPKSDLVCKGFCPCHAQEKKCEMDCHYTHIGHGQHCETSDLPPYHHLPQEKKCEPEKVDHSKCCAQCPDATKPENPQESEGGWDKSIHWTCIEVILENMSPKTIREVKEAVGRIVSSQAQEIWELVERAIPTKKSHKERGYILDQTTEKEEGWNECVDEIETSLQQQLKEKYLK